MNSDVQTPSPSMIGASIFQPHDSLQRYFRARIASIHSLKSGNDWQSSYKTQSPCQIQYVFCGRAGYGHYCEDSERDELTQACLMQEATRPQRKSVAFSEGATIVDGDGNTTEVNGHSNQTSAENHTVGTVMARQSSIFPG